MIRMGEIAISEGSRIDVSGDGGGGVRVRSARLDVDDSRIRADTEGELSGGFIDVQVDVLTYLIRRQVVGQYAQRQQQPGG